MHRVDDLHDGKSRASGPVILFYVFFWLFLDRMRAREMSGRDIGNALLWKNAARRSVAFIARFGMQVAARNAPARVSGDDFSRYLEGNVGATAFITAFGRI